MREKYWFDNETGTFFISDPDTGKYWYNQLWNTDGYHMSVSHVGSGISRYVDDEARQAVLNVEEARFLYIRDEDSFSYWNIGISPSLTPVENYLCEHGQGYTKIASEYNGIQSSIMYTLPDTGTYEIWKVTLKNTTGSPRTLSLFPLIRFDLGGFKQPAYYNPMTTSETMFLEELNGVFCWSRNPHQPHKYYSGFLSSSEKVQYYDGWLEKFIGSIGNYAKPDVITKGKNCTNSSITVRVRGAVLQNIIELGSNEEKTIYYFAGFSSDPATVIMEYKSALKSAEALCESAVSKGIKRFGTLRVNTPDQQINNIMNFWAQKQVAFCMIGKKAVRDNAQVAMSILNFDSKLAEKTIYECLCHQYSNGSAVLTWSPAIDPKLYSDPAMWLLLASCELIKETGRTDFLNLQVPYLDCGSATVYEHLKKAVEWLLSSIGPHGLPLIHYADWNDALNIPDKNAESIFMAMAVSWALNELSQLSFYLGDMEYGKAVQEHRKKLVDLTNQTAWNGEYYVRALSELGPIGDKNSTVGGKIYLNPQTWAILADAVPADRLDSVLKSIDSMDTEYGTPLCMPTYEEYNPIVGRMSGMLPGVYENGGIYNHAVGFKIMADCKVGRKDKAYESLIKMIPDGVNNPSSITTTEPYVFTNCYLMHKSSPLVVGFSWQTGASAWGLRSFYEGILGLKRTYEGLQIKPVLPSNWNYVKVSRTFRACHYEIEYFNTGNNAISIFVDGEKISCDILPVFSDNKVHRIVVET